MNRIIKFLLIISLPGFSIINQAAADTDNSCGRNCLTGFIDRYMEAMNAHDPGILAVSSNMKFTEDTVEMKLGEGLWKNITGLTDYRMDILDIYNNTAISLAVVEESNRPVMVALRLRVDGMKLSEVETMVVRNQQEGMIYKPGALVHVSEEMVMQPEVSLRNSRREMIDIASLYPEGLKSGSFVTVDVPFAADAYRFENGQLMAGPGCTFFPGCDDIKNQRIPTLSDLTYEVAAVDEELGIVLLRMDFGKGATFDGNNSLNVWEAFKVYNDQIHAVEAFMEVIPIGVPSGWDD